MNSTLKYDAANSKFNPILCVMWMSQLLKAYTNNTNDLYEVFGNYTALY